MHTIRLRKQWTRTVDGDPPMEKIDVPDMASFGSDAATSVTYRRTFNQTTGIEQASVRLRVSQWDGTLFKLALNGCDCTIDLEQTSIDADITDALQKHNELVLVIKPTSDSVAGLSGDVSLAIED